MPRCKCAVFGCPSASYNKKCKDLNFHFFPNKPKLQKIWVDACKNKKISRMSKRSLVICSLHFKESDYTTVLMKKKNDTSAAVKILTNSIPTLNLPGAKSNNKKSPASNEKTRKTLKENTTYKEKLKSIKSHAENKSSPEEKTTVKKEEEPMSLDYTIYKLIKENYSADNSHEVPCEEFRSYGSLIKPEPNTTVFNDEDLITAKEFGFDDSEEEDVIKMEPDSEVDYEPEVPEGTQLSTIETVEIHDSVSQPPNKKMKPEPKPEHSYILNSVTYERGNEQDNEDDSSTFAAHLKARMRLLDPHQKCIAQKHLSDVMFMVETKQLHLTTEIIYRQPRS